MPIEFGKKHGTGYHANVDRSVKFKTNANAKECTSPKVMKFRLNNDMVLKQCPSTCEFFEECLNKSLELKNEK